MTIASAFVHVSEVMKLRKKKSTFNLEEAFSKNKDLLTKQYIRTSFMDAHFKCQDIILKITGNF